MLYKHHTDEGVSSEEIAALDEKIEKVGVPKVSTWRRFKRMFVSDDDGKDPYGLTAEQRVEFLRAVPLYEQHINTANAAHNWKEVAQRCGQLAKIRLFLGDRAGAATTLVNQSKATINLAEQSTEDTTVQTLILESITLRESAITQALAGGHYHQAATYLQGLATFIRRGKDIPYLPPQQKAVDLLLQAGKLFQENGHPQHGIDCKGEVAVTLQREKRYKEAMELWEQCAEHCTETPLLRMSAIRHVVSAALCHLSHLAKEYLDDVAEGDKEDPHTIEDNAHEHLLRLSSLDSQFTPQRKEYCILEELDSTVALLVEGGPGGGAIKVNFPEDRDLKPLSLDPEQHRLITQLRDMVGGQEEKKGVNAVKSGLKALFRHDP